GAAQIVGADLEKCVPAMANIAPQKGRGRRHTLSSKSGKFTLIDESYNSNPASAAAAIDLLAAAKPSGKGRRIAVLGDMLELGGAAARLHKSLKKPLETAGIDRVYLVGPQMKRLAEMLEPGLLAGHFETAADIEKPLISALKAGDVVMVKASLGLKFTGLVDALLAAFPAAGQAAGPDAGRESTAERATG
ncbi:MAG: UDP-N-acetylmuramoylalanyl-D-glutamyl-2, 6-diaminopimelate--D-alanyl-D-alanine ligase, partial [Planctomycetes bacterium]|nr:UDP-N-acetylmuramoylalanyl-D-glutamyl-2, 6-diaminopimelate--D-alanyl-D-alanine ligase [Planctomycetota bacterium]